MVLFVVAAGLGVGALLAYLMVSGVLALVAEVLRNAPALWPHRGQLLSLPLADQLALARALPDVELGVVAPHLDKLLPHRAALLAALPKLRPHMSLCMRRFNELAPHVKLIVPVLPALAVMPEADVRAVVTVSPTLVRALGTLDADTAQRASQGFVSVLPALAPHLTRMEADGTLALCLVHLDDVVVPMLPLLSQPEVQRQLPLLLAHAKRLMPYAPRLIPYARELLPHAAPLLEDGVWAKLQPHLDELLAVMPRVLPHIGVVVSCMDAALVHLDRLGPYLSDITVYANQVLPHTAKLMQHCDALMDHWPELRPHLKELVAEIDILILYIDDLVPQLPYLAPHLDVIIPELSKTAQYTPHLIRDYGGALPYIHHALSLPGAARLLPTLGSIAQGWHDLTTQAPAATPVPATVPAPAKTTPPASPRKARSTPPPTPPPSLKDSVEVRPPAPSTPPRSPEALTRSQSQPRASMALLGPWEPDNSRTTCNFCPEPFAWNRRRHHCRICGKLCCSACSPHLMIVPELGPEAVRACNVCKEYVGAGTEK